MKCPRCQSQNREGVRFCEECGARLVTSCPSCGAELLPDKRFCGSCGSPTTPEPVERQEQFPASGHTTLIYRGRRLLPESRRIFGWLSTVRHWDVERHEVRIELDGDLVRDVQAEVRRYRLSAEEAR